MALLRNMQWPQVDSNRAPSVQDAAEQVVPAGSSFLQKDPENGDTEVASLVESGSNVQAPVSLRVAAVEPHLRDVASVADDHQGVQAQKELLQWQAKEIEELRREVKEIEDERQAIREKNKAAGKISLMGNSSGIFGNVRAEIPLEVLARVRAANRRPPRKMPAAVPEENTIGLNFSHSAAKTNNDTQTPVQQQAGPSGPAVAADAAKRDSGVANVSKDFEPGAAEVTPQSSLWAWLANKLQNLFVYLGLVSRPPPKLLVPVVNVDTVGSMLQTRSLLGLADQAGETIVSGEYVAVSPRSKELSEQERRLPAVQLRHREMNVLCQDLRLALPFLPQEVLRIVDSKNNSCRVSVQEKSCVSHHPYWQCIYDAKLPQAACACHWSTVCHGITDVLNPAEGLPLVCGPEFDTCRCAGFAECPTNSEQWECHAASVTEPESKLINAVNLDEKGRRGVLERGLCRCLPIDSGVWVHLNHAEAHELMQYPLEEVVVVPKPAASVHAQNNADQISDKIVAPPSELFGGARTGLLTHAFGGNVSEETKFGPASGHCKVPDGRMVYSNMDLAISAFLVLPLFLATLIVVHIRWNLLSCVFTTLCRGCVCDCLTRFLRGPSLTPRGERPEAVASFEAGDSGSLPPNVLVLLCALFFMLHLCATIIATPAHVITGQMEGFAVDALPHGRLQTYTSGIILVSLPIGGIAGIVYAARNHLNRPKRSCLSACALLCLGCILSFQALRSRILLLLIIGRVLCGCAQGACFVGQTFLLKLCSKDSRGGVVSSWEFAIAAGLLAGPFQASFLKVWIDKSSVGEANLQVTACLSLALLVIFAFVFPSDNSLGMGDIEGTKPCWQVDDIMSDDKCVAQLVTVASSMLRMVQRLLWEFAAILVLASSFCLDGVDSGVRIMSVAPIAVFAQMVVVPLCSAWSGKRFTQACEIMQILGLFIAYQLPRTMGETPQPNVVSSQQLMAFLAGSVIYFVGNCASSVPMFTWGVEEGPREQCILFYTHLGYQVGFCFVFWNVRFIAGLFSPQTVLFALLLPLSVFQIGLSELGPGFLRSRKPAVSAEKFLPPHPVPEHS